MGQSGRSGDHSYSHIRINHLIIMVLEEEKVIQRRSMIVRLVVGIREGYPKQAKDPQVSCCKKNICFVYSIVCDLYFIDLYNHKNSGERKKAMFLAGQRMRATWFWTQGHMPPLPLRTLLGPPLPPNQLYFHTQSSCTHNISYHRNFFLFLPHHRNSNVREFWT